MRCCFVLWMRVIVVLAVMLIVCTAFSGDRPRVYTVLVALDDSWQSRMLKSELTRDWERCESSARLDLKTRDKLWGLNQQAWVLRRSFRFVFDAEAPIGTKKPAIRIGAGTWETLDKRIFRYSTLPLQSICWYRDIETLSPSEDGDYVSCQFEKDNEGRVIQRYEINLKVPQAPWLPAGESPVVRGVWTKRTYEGFLGDGDNGP